MADPLVIKDATLAQYLQDIAQRERRPVESVLLSMVFQYKPASSAETESDGESLALAVRKANYDRAREYWAQTGQTDRAAMSDAQLDDQFWLFDADGVPRLKSDQTEISLPASSLYLAAATLRSAGFHSGQSEISAQSRNILDAEFAEYLLSNMSRPPYDADNSTPD